MSKASDTLTGNMRTEMDRLRAFVVARRKELGLTQRALAEAAGIPDSTIGAIEAGSVTRSPAIDTLDALALGLKVSPYKLLAVFRGDDTAHLEPAKLESLPPAVRRLLELLLRLPIEEVLDYVEQIEWLAARRRQRP